MRISRAGLLLVALLGVTGAVVVFGVSTDGRPVDHHAPTTVVLGPPSIGGPTASSPASVTTPVLTIPASAPPVGGYLPDGTPFSIVREPSRDEDVTGVSGVVVVEQDDGSVRAAGATSFLPSRVARRSFDGRLLRVPAGEWTFQLRFDPDVLSRLVTDPAEVVAGSIAGGPDRGLPRVRLDPPFRWAGDDELPAQMQVMYESFVARRGCGELAVACSQTGAVQVIPLDRLSAPAPECGGARTWVESPAPRPIADPHYLDPGPLAPRGDLDVVWTGEEMIVWGGTAGEGSPPLVDGAAYDPESEGWRVLSPSRLHAGTTSRAVWVDDRMVVLSPDVTLAYDPRTDRWQEIAKGLFPPREGLMVAAAEQVFAWNRDGIHRLEVGGGLWERLPDPGFGGPDRWVGSLVSADGRIFAAGLTGETCSGRRMAEWAETAWVPLPDVSLATATYADCSLANQIAVAGGTVLVWEDEEHPTMVYDPEVGRWEEVARIPLTGTEGPSGGVVMGDRILVPQHGESAIYDPGTRTWTRAALPGHGDDTNMVWTGKQVLMWGATCCYGTPGGSFRVDAWSWRPGG